MEVRPMSHQSNADLRRYYRVANRKYFKGKLPDIPVRFAKVNRLVLGILWINPGDVPSDIEISEELRYVQNLTIMTLLHEMVHVENPRWKGHGWRFDRRMKQLAQDGAFDGLW
jgi:hypothetical protein